jgi:hypothetical protein
MNLSNDRERLERYQQAFCRPIIMQVHEIEMLGFTLGRWRMHLAQQPARLAVTQKIEAIDALVLRLHETLPPKDEA